jgi:hypothetical protein
VYGVLVESGASVHPFIDWCLFRVCVAARFLPLQDQFSSTREVLLLGPRTGSQNAWLEHESSFPVQECRNAADSGRSCHHPIPLRMYAYLPTRLTISRSTFGGFVRPGTVKPKCATSEDQVGCVLLPAPLRFVVA